jgi:hypothetical protein
MYSGTRTGPAVYRYCIRVRRLRTTSILMLCFVSSHSLISTESHHLSMISDLLLKLSDAEIN